MGMSSISSCGLLFSCSLIFDSLQPHGLQHIRLPCPSLSFRVCSNSCLLSQWCYPTVSLSVAPFSSFWSFSFSISPSNEYLGFIFFRIDWFDLLAVQETLKSLLQQHNSKASILQHSVFFLDQISYLYLTTRKTIALTIWTFVSKVMSLLFNTLSRFVIAFLLRSKRLLIQWLLSSSALILESKKIKSVTVSTFSPSICHEVMGLDAMILVFWMLSFRWLFHSHQGALSFLFTFCH